MGLTRPHVLAIPGLLCDEFVWRAHAAALAPLADVTIVDLTAHDDLQDMARAAIEEVDGAVHVVGHSLGGRVAFEIWRLAPARVQSIVVLDTGVHPAAPGERESRQRVLDLAAVGMEALADAWLPPMVHPDRLADEPFMDELRAMVCRSDATRHARQIAALLGRPDAEPVLASINVPALVIVGRQDQWSPVAQHEHITAAIPDARLEIVEDSGHMVTVEQPDAVASLLVDWIVGFAATPTSAPNRDC